MNPTKKHSLKALTGSVDSLVQTLPARTFKSVSFSEGRFHFDCSTKDEYLFIRTRIKNLLRAMEHSIRWANREIWQYARSDNQSTVKVIAIAASQSARAERGRCAYVLNCMLGQLKQEGQANFLRHNPQASGYQKPKAYRPKAKKSKTLWGYDSVAGQYRQLNSNEAVVRTIVPSLVPRGVPLAKQINADRRDTSENNLRKLMESEQKTPQPEMVGHIAK